MPSKFIAVICDVERDQISSIERFIDQNIHTEKVNQIWHPQGTVSWVVDSTFSDSITGEDLARYLLDQLNLSSFAVFDFDRYKEKIETCWVSPGGEEELPWLRACAFEYFQSSRHGFYYL